MKKLNEAISSPHLTDYKFLVENTSDIISLTDKEANIKFLSASFENITGFKISEFTGRSILDLVHTDDAGIVISMINEAVCSPGTSYKCVYRLLLKSGEWKYFESNGKYAKDEYRDLLVISTRNVNEKVELEKELERKDRIYETILRNFPHGTITLYDKEFRYVFCDGLELKTVGMTSEKIIGKTIYDILPEDKANHLRQYLEPSLKDGSEHEYEIENHGRHYRLITLPIIDANGNIDECLAITQNITETKKAEENLRKSQEKLKLAHRVANIGSWEWDFKDNKFSWSDELYELLGKDRDFKPGFDSYIQSIHPADRKYIESVIKKSAAEKSHFGVDCRIQIENDEVKYQHIEGDVFTDEMDQSEKVIGVCYDITEKKKFEEYLIESNRMLKEMQDELIHSEKLAAVGRIASSMAHEIRNPLANIKASSQLLQGKHKSRQESDNYLSIIIRNIDNADRIIRDLLDYSSPGDMKLSEGSILSVINEVRKLTEPRCRKYGITFVINNNVDELPVVLLNEEKLAQAFLNFFSNSIEAIKGKGKLSVTIDYADVLKSKLLIILKDTGKGIEQENLNKILEPFFTTKANGTGLGLSIAHQILGMHNASFKISSEEHKGTEIRIIFPIAKPHGNPM